MNTFQSEPVGARRAVPITILTGFHATGKTTLACAGCVLLLTLLVPFVMAGAGETPCGPAAEFGGITVRSSQFPSGTVTLTNGEYREPAAPGSARGTVVKLTNTCALGTVDGRDAAAVVLVTDPGGSGTFYDLALLIKGKDGWVNVDTVLMGDRIEAHSLDMKDNEIFIRMSTHGPGDALCCPTEEVVRRFAVQGDRIVAKGEEQRPGVREQEIIGPVWQWVRTQYSNDTALTSPADTPGYRFQMRQDGTIQVRADCNRGGGSFILNGRSLAITITHTTRAACPEGSLGDTFIRDLNRTGGLSLKDGRLFLGLKYDSGTMEFREGGKSAGE